MPFFSLVEKFTGYGCKTKHAKDRACNGENPYLINFDCNNVLFIWLYIPLLSCSWIILYTHSYQFSIS